MLLRIGSFCLLALAGCASDSLLPGHYVVLPEASAGDALRHCSRQSPSDVEGTWSPSEADIAQLEEDLPKLARLKASLCCLAGTRISNPGWYFRQYIGLTIRGQRLIYINAFFDPADHPGHPAWLQRPVDACDGGSGFWSAVYDPKRRRFSELAVNGVG